MKKTGREIWVRSPAWQEERERGNRAGSTPSDDGARLGGMNIMHRHWELRRE